MGFEGYDRWKATDPRIERDGERAELDELPIYRLMFSYKYSGCVRVWFERLDANDVQAGWKRLQSAEGVDERSAIATLRDHRRGFLAAVRRARAEREVREEATYRRLREAGINPREGVFGGSR